MIVRAVKTILNRCKAALKQNNFSSVLPPPLTNKLQDGILLCYIPVVELSRSFVPKSILRANQWSIFLWRELFKP